MPQISKHFDRRADHIGQLDHGNQASDIYLTFRNEVDAYKQNGGRLGNLQKRGNPLDNELMLQQYRLAFYSFLISRLHRSCHILMTANKIFLSSFFICFHSFGKTTDIAQIVIIAFSHNIKTIIIDTCSLT